MSLILDLIFPKTCFGCGKTSQYFCSKCLSKIKFHTVKYSSDPSKEGSLSLFYFHGLIRRAIQSLKYEFVTDIVDELTDIFTQKIKLTYPHLVKYWQQNNFVLTPVPLYFSRQNWRGFNQSELLAKSISLKLKINYSDQIFWRHKHTFTQSKIKTVIQRQNNTREIFSPILPIPKNLIIFDDVASSFSTLNSAYSSIKPFGLNHCWFLTLAG